MNGKKKLLFLILFLFFFIEYLVGYSIEKLLTNKQLTKSSLIHLEKHLKLNPEDTWGYFQLAIFDWQLKKNIKYREGSYLFKGKTDKLFFYIGIRKILEKDFLSAIKFLEKAIRLNSSNQVFFEIYLDIINEYDFKDRALKFLFSFKRKNCEVLSAISEVYLYKNDYKNFKKYLERLKGCENKEKNISIFLLKCQDLAFRNRFDEAIKRVREEIKFYEKLKNSQNLSYLHLLLGTFYFFKYRYKNADDELLKALEICEKTPNIYLENSILSALADYYISIDYYSEAEQVLKRLLKNVEIFGGIESEVDIYMKLGDIYDGMGDFYNSIYYYNKALDLAYQIKDTLNYTLILFRLGDIELSFKNFDDAKKYYLMGLKNKKVVSLYRLESTLYSGLGEVYEGLGFRGKAEKFYKKALEYSIKNRDLSTLAYLNLVMSTFYSKYDTKKSIKYAKKAYILYKKLKNPDAQKNSLLSMAYAFYLNGQYKDAISWLKKLYLNSIETSDFPYAFISSGMLGKCFKKMGNMEDSLFYFEKSYDFIEKISHFLLSDISYRLDFESSVHRVFEEYIDTCYQLYKKGHDTYYLKKSFKIVEKYKTEDFLFLYFKNRVFSQLENVPSEMKLKFYILDKKINFLRGKFIISNDQSEKLSLKNRISNLIRIRENFIKKMDFGNFMNLARKNIITIDEIKNLLDDKSVSVEIFIGREHSFFWIISRNEVIFKEFPLTEKELENSLKKISFNIFYQKRKINFIVDSSFAGFNPKELMLFYKKYFKEIFEKINKGKNVIVSPDSQLLIFPLEALIEKYSINNVKFLIDDYIFSYVPSLSFLKFSILQLSKNSKAKGILSVGISNFAKTKGVSSLKHLRYLRYSQEEAMEIASLFKNSKYLIDGDATEYNFKKMCRAFSVIHLSTHIMINEKMPIFSKIILLPDLQWKEDGILYGYELSKINFHARLMVLNGCESGRGKIFQGTGLFGISKILLSSGISSVLVTLWPVNDYFAKEFMVKFYSILKENNDPKTALKETKKYFMKDVKYRDPFFWASYILIGSSSKIKNLRANKNLPVKNLMIILIYSVIILSLIFISLTRRIF